MAEFRFACTYCGWSGTQPTLDAHLNAWCPTCGKPAEFEDVLRARQKPRSPPPSADAPDS